MHVPGASSLVFAAAVLIASALAELSTTQVVQKDAGNHADAEGSKRPYPGFDLDKYQELHEANKHLRVPDGYLERLLSEQLEKRASMRGFQGMRGKKTESYDVPAFYKAQLLEPYYDGLSYYYDKRTPMGFQGMRGKKNLEEVLDELEKRSKMGFQGMRGKKSEYEEQPQVTGEYHKRGPVEFQGLQGRKSNFLEEPDDLEKRALLGFHGMRGKKDMSYEELPMDLDGYLEKRAMMIGFHGMRGKRNINYYGSRYEKRSPYRYFDTRGKKNPRWELRGKFVGVRGKKWTGAPRRLPASFYEELMESSRH